jgi:hypothetical protein
MKIPRLLLITLIMFSCSGVKVLNTDHVDGFALSNYKTFDFYKIEGSGDTSSNFTANAELLKKEIERHMKAKGLSRTETDPDLLINIGAVVLEKIQTRETDFRTDGARYMGQRNYSWKSEEVEVGRYKEGTVTVHLVDPKTKKLMWKGAVEGILPNKESNIPNTIKEGMDALFMKL